MRTIVLLIILSVFISFITFAKDKIQHIKPNKSKGSWTFAIVIDKDTYDNTEKEVLAYKNSIEEQDAIVHIIIATKSSALPIRKAVQKIYQQSKPKLEGIVLIGDIPLPRLKHLEYYSNSSYELDAFAPTDRFYDDLDMQFFSSKSPNNFIIDIAKQAILKREIYSGRITPSGEVNQEYYRKIRAFLKKAIRLKSNPPTIEKILAYLGVEYCSECPQVRDGELEILKESFRKIFDKGLINYFHSGMGVEIKELLIKELEKPKSGITVFHTHGHCDKQFLYDKNNISLTFCPKDFNCSKVMSNFAIFDACDNAITYTDNENIILHYLFETNEMVVGTGFSITVLQDIYPSKMLGLLKYGLRLGKYHLLNNYYRYELFGDPTFAFKQTDKSVDLNSIFDRTDPKIWKKFLTSGAADLRELAIVKLYGIQPKKFQNELKQIFINDKSPQVRFHALGLLAQVGSSHLNALLPIAIKDKNELVRRFAAKWMGSTGKRKFVHIAMERAKLKPGKRVEHNILNTMEQLLSPVTQADRELLVKELPGILKYISKSGKLLNYNERYFYNEEIITKFNLLKNPDWGTSLARFNLLKQIITPNLHSALSVYLSLLANKKESIRVKIEVLKRLRLFTLSSKRKQIVKSLQSFEKELKNKKKTDKNKEEIEAAMNLAKFVQLRYKEGKQIFERR